MFDLLACAADFCGFHERTGRAIVSPGMFPPVFAPAVQRYACRCSVLDAAGATVAPLPVGVLFALRHTSP